MHQEEETVASIIDTKKLFLIRRIHENGLAAAYYRASNKEMRQHNDAYWDLVIGKAVTKLAYEMHRSRVPPIVEEYLKEHYEQEAEHSAMFPIVERDPLAMRIADFHKKILREHGLVQYFACFGLLGERMALADGAFFHAERDPHGTVEGFRDEMHHTSWPLVLLTILNPKVEELEDAIECQNLFLKMITSH